MTTVCTVQESGITLDFQYITFLHRLFTYEVIDELYVPISDIDKREQKQSAHLNWQVCSVLSAPRQP